MIKENWCNEFSRPLGVFNKAFIRRMGKGLHPYLVLTGDIKDCNYCVKKEAQMFYENGVFDSVDILDPRKDNKRGVYFQETWDDKTEDKYDELAKAGSLLFFNDENVKMANKYDISGCRNILFKERFLKKSDMQCDADFDFIINKYPKLLDMDMEVVVNNTVLKHYDKADDDVIHMSDFEWVDENSAKTYNTENNLNATDDTILAGKEDKKDTSDADKDNVANGTVSKEIEKPDTKNAFDKKENLSKLEDTTKKEKVKQKNENKITKKKDQKRNPEQEQLTKGEEEKNHELLHTVRREYTELLEYLESLNASIWKPIERIIKNSLETNEYDDSIILKYLELSKDLTSELYRRLYEKTEPARREFCTKVKRKYKKIVCFNCSTSWEIDVTFMDKDHDEAECPTCGTFVGYDKD